MKRNIQIERRQLLQMSTALTEYIFSIPTNIFEDKGNAPLHINIDENQLD